MGSSTSSEECLEQLLVHLNKVLQGLHCHLHIFLVPDHHLIRILLNLFLSCIFMLTINDPYPLADMSQLIRKNHPLLLFIVLFFEKSHHFIKISIIVDLSKVLFSLLSECIDILHDFKSILYAVVVKL